jgi:enterochelin esterase-like enzyme
MPSILTRSFDGTDQIAPVMHVSSLAGSLLGALMIGAVPVLAADDYPPHPDSVAQVGVPKGRMIQGSFKSPPRSVFPGTARDYQVYLPAGIDISKPAPFMVFQDGLIYNAAVVFDNLIARRELPPLIGIFIKPGVVPAVDSNSLPRFNRSHEYDSVDDTYSKFLIAEFLPAISERHGIRLSEDPNDAAICGNSSGGICAFMTAWHRPDRFRRVFTGVGTYIGINGADRLAVLVRKVEPKPLRVYLQSGEQDNNLYCGDWWMANQTMERSLSWAGYDVNHTWGDGGHNAKQATAIFPDVMRWLWRGWPESKEIKANPGGGSKWLGYQVMKEGSRWEELRIQVSGARSLASNSAGEVVVIDEVAERLHLIDQSGQTRVIGSTIDAPRYAAWGPGDTLFVSGSRKEGGTRIVALDSNGDSRVVVNQDGAAIQGLAITRGGHIYFSAADGAIWHVVGNGAECLTVVGEGENPDPMCDRFLTLSPDQGFLIGSGEDPGSFQLQADASIANAQEFYHLEDGQWSAPGGLCVDTEGRLYVATELGIQVCDQAGRVNFIIPTPQTADDVCFGGKDLGELFIACGDRVYKRPTRVRGIVSGQMAPVKPAPPKL